MMENYLHGIFRNMVQYFENDVRRINHAIKVYTLASEIGAGENLTVGKLTVLQAAAILHDIGIKGSEQKYNSSAGKYQEQEGPAVARELMKEFALDQTLLDRICFLIGNHHSYHKIDDMDFQILVEADFLVNIFEDDMNDKQIASIKEKYFKTQTGIKYMQIMYPVYMA